MRAFSLLFLMNGVIASGILPCQLAPKQSAPTVAAKIKRGLSSAVRGQTPRRFIAAVAPPFEGPYYKVGYKTEWRLIDKHGHESILLVLIPDGTTASQIETATASLDSRMVDELKKDKIVSVLSFPDTKFIRLPKDLAKSDKIVALTDIGGKIQRLFAPAAKTITLVGIDKAGFLRCITPVQEPASLGQQLLQAASQMPVLEEGKPAPDFQMRDMNGRLRRLRDLRGRRNLLLTFYPKCFTFTCTAQLTSLRDSNDKFAANDTEIWGVSTDSANGERGQRAFAKHLELNYPLIPDTGRNLSILFGAANSPNQVSARMSVLIDKNGIVRWINKQIDPRRHGDEVLEKLQELNLGKEKK